ncbi:MAG: hypothetical protein SFX74_02990 [Fimbriimonadaceae bacterium]|nr:hypothetical protein [Fimbriimonadaceae bacterium]
MKTLFRTAIVAALAISFTLPLVSTAAAQSEPATAQRSLELQLKMRKIDLLLQIMPLALRRDQFDKILPVYAKVRAEQRKVRENEDIEILKLEAEVNTAVDKALKDGVYPPRELVRRCINVMSALGFRRRMARVDLTEMMYKVFIDTLDAGQKKVAANAVNWKEMDPSFDAEKATETDKIKLFINFFMLDELSFDVLVELDKKVREG